MLCRSYSRIRAKEFQIKSLLTHNAHWAPLVNSLAFSLVCLYENKIEERPTCTELNSLKDGWDKNVIEFQNGWVWMWLCWLIENFLLVCQTDISDPSLYILFLNKVGVQAMPLSFVGKTFLYNNHHNNHSGNRPNISH